MLKSPTGQIEPSTDKVDHKKLLADIIAADDGREPMDKARHNMADPTPLEVLDFVCAAMDDYDDLHAKIIASVRYLLKQSTVSVMRESLLENLNGR